MANQPTLSQKYDDLASKLSAVAQDLSRTDERVEIFVEKTNSLERKVDHHVENCPVRCKFADMIARIQVLESKNGKEIKSLIQTVKDECDEDIKLLLVSDKEMQAVIHHMELEQQSMKDLVKRGENKWRTFGWIALNIIVPIVWVTVASFILYYLGITSPPIP